MAAGRDIVILGGGHNGLVTAFYLAKAGYKPLVVERRGVVGGAAITDDFHPGFKCSTLAYADGPLLPEIVRDMELESHGLSMIHPHIRLFALSPDGHGLLLFSNPADTAAHLSRISRNDSEKYVEFSNALERYGAILRQVLTLTPPDIDKPSTDEIWKLLKVGRNVRGLGKKDMMRLLRWGPMAVADLASEFFETELLRGAIAARGIFGAALGPWSAGSTALLLL
ncbi:MAG: NAD(P)-binding protein, partial [Candidatus Acidiferrales bacterium]